MRKGVVLRRPYTGGDDRQRMVALASAHPEQSVHQVDLPYRLSSWALDDANNVALWSNMEGRLVAWAVMQTPFWAVDYVYEPGLDPDLHRRILAWADERARQLVGTPDGRPAWFVSVLRGQEDRIGDLEAMGFACQAAAPKDPWSDVLLWCPVSTPLQRVSPPEGYVIRPLRGAEEVPAYVALHRSVFESSAMTVEWRLRTLECPQYLPDLDLVMVAPGDALVAFCIGWVGIDAEDRRRGQIEPLGVRADRRRQGLGRAILSEALRRLRHHDVSGTLIQTEAYRGPALSLYESVGFRAMRDVWIYRKDYV
jgi:mycothiol synthase